MKNLLSVLLLVCMGGLAHAQHDKKVEAKITDATVFLNKAQISRKVKTSIEMGRTNLRISGLSSALDQESIQVTGKGSFIILGIAHQQNFLDELNIPKDLRTIRDSIAFIQRQLIVENSQKEILGKEEQMLLTNQKIGGNNQNLTVAELRAMADFFRSRLSEIVVARVRQDEKIKKLNERLEKLQRQLNEQHDFYRRNTSEIVVSLSAETPTGVDLDVSYIVPNAGWYPVYDLRAENIKSPVKLSYKANVFQSTGEDWNSIKLRLSTANPSLGGRKPELAAWYLNFYEPVVRSPKYKGAVSRSTAPSAMDDSEALQEIVAMPTAPSETTSDYVTTVQTTLNTEFDISLPYTIKSSGKPTLVDIRNHELKSTYQYSSAPRLDPDAFLMARATGWEDFSLLPGEANVFFEGTFVAKTFIDPNSIRDTLSISLGRDKRIIVKREKLKELSSRKMIGSNQRAAYAFEISVRNTKSEPVTVLLEDQIPVSQNSQIEVTIADQGGAKYNQYTGKLTWEMSLQPNETKKVGYRYEVKYPKDRVIAGME
jgi:uncharacterized protein (TIGR02231 family)